MTLDLSQPLQTQDGTSVTLICQHGRDADYPVMGYIGDATTISFWTADGGHNSSNPHLDLKNLPVVGEVWVIRYVNDLLQLSQTAQEAQQASDYAATHPTSAQIKTIIKLTYSVEPGHNDLED